MRKEINLFYIIKLMKKSGIDLFFPTQLIIQQIIPIKLKK